MLESHSRLVVRGISTYNTFPCVVCGECCTDLDEFEF